LKSGRTKINAHTGEQSVLATISSPTKAAYTKAHEAAVGEQLVKATIRPICSTRSRAVSDGQQRKQTLGRIPRRIAEEFVHRANLDWDDRGGTKPSENRSAAKVTLSQVRTG